MDYKFDRYAVCWSAPWESDLGEFGVNWTGWCPEYGVHAGTGGCRGADIDGVDLPRDLANRGLFANIRSPFRLAPGRSRWKLEQALDALAQSTPEIPMPDMVPMISHGQIVMAPNRMPAQIARLIEHVGEKVRLFQAVPAPAIPRAEQAPAAGVILDDPVAPVTETFHMPLTGHLPEIHAAQKALQLGERVAPMLKEVGSISHIDLMGDPGEGRPWRLVERYALSSDASRWGLAPVLSGATRANSVPQSSWHTVLS